MQRVVDSYREYGGKYSGNVTHKTRPGALVFQDDELARVLKALRRGSAKDKALAKKAYKMLTGFERCPECGRLTTHHVYTDRNKEEWWCEKCQLSERLKNGWSISKLDAVSNFTRREYEELCLMAGLKGVELLSYADEFYGNRQH